MPRLVTDLILCLLLSGLTLTTACDLPTIMTCSSSVVDLLENDGGFFFTKPKPTLETICKSIDPVNTCASSLAETCISDETNGELKGKVSKMMAGVDILVALCKLYVQETDKAGCKESDILGCIKPGVEELVSVSLVNNPFGDPPCKALIPVGVACLEGIKDSCDDGYAKSFIQYMLGYYNLLKPNCDIEGENPFTLPSEPPTSKDDNDPNTSEDDSSDEDSDDWWDVWG